jgi:hypothetical protein
VLGHVQPYYPLPRCPGTFTRPDHGLRPGPAPAVPGFAADAGGRGAGRVRTPGVPGWWAVALRQRRQARSVRVTTVRPDEDGQCKRIHLRPRRGKGRLNCPALPVGC